MSWLGVPFTTPESFDGFNWTDPAFWQQFVDQTNARRAAFGSSPLTWDILAGVTVAQPMPIGIGPGATVNLVTWRRFPIPLDLTGKGFGTVPSVGGSYPSAWMVRAGSITQAFLDRVNAFLVAAGCPEMGSTPVAGDGVYTMGIPWTRKHGPPDAPTTSYGEPQEGDIIGRWIFNEWWAILSCMDTLVFSPAAVAATFDGEAVFGVGDQATAEDALAEAETAFDLASPDDPGPLHPQGQQEGVIQLHIPGAGSGHQVILARVRGGWAFTGLDVPGAAGNAYAAHFAAEDVTDGAWEPFGDTVEQSKFAFVDTHSAWSPSPGTIETTPHVPLTPAPTSPFTPTSSMVNRGYVLTPLVFVPLSIPPP